MVGDLASFKERHVGDGVGRDVIAAEVSRSTGDSKAKTRVVVDLVLASIQEALENGKRVELRGFGTFLPHRSNARRCHVPSKGRVVRVDARWKVVFKTSECLKSSLMEHLEG